MQDELRQTNAEMEGEKAKMEDERTEKAQQLEDLKLQIEEKDRQIQNAVDNAKAAQAILDEKESELQNLKQVLEEKESFLESQAQQLREIRLEFDRLMTEGQALSESKEAISARYIWHFAFLCDWTHYKCFILTK